MRQLRPPRPPLDAFAAPVSHAVGSRQKGKHLWQKGKHLCSALCLRTNGLSPMSPSPLAVLPSLRPSLPSHMEAPHVCCACSEHRVAGLYRSAHELGGRMRGHTPRHSDFMSQVLSVGLIPRYLRPYTCRIQPPMLLSQIQSDAYVISQTPTIFKIWPVFLSLFL